MMASGMGMGMGGIGRMGNVGGVGGMGIRMGVGVGGASGAPLGASPMDTSGV